MNNNYDPRGCKAHAPNIILNGAIVRFHSELKHVSGGCFFLRCVSRATCFSLAAASWFAALTEVHIPFLSTVHAELQAGNKPIEIKVKVIPRPAAYSSAQIPSSSLPQSPRVPRLLFTSSSPSTRPPDAEESHKTTF